MSDYQDNIFSLEANIEALNEEVKTLNAFAQTQVAMNQKVLEALIKISDRLDELDGGGK